MCSPFVGSRGGQRIDARHAVHVSGRTRRCAIYLTYSVYIQTNKTKSLPMYKNIYPRCRLNALHEHGIESSAAFTTQLYAGFAYVEAVPVLVAGALPVCVPGGARCARIEAIENQTVIHDRLP